MPVAIDPALLPLIVKLCPAFRPVIVPKLVEAAPTMLVMLAAPVSVPIPVAVEASKSTAIAAP